MSLQLSQLLSGTSPDSFYFYENSFDNQMLCIC